MIAIVLLTCDRPKEREEYAFKTLDALKNLSAAGDDLWMHIADDGSDPEFREEMVRRAREQYGDRTSVSNSEERGYGGNYNLASQAVHQAADLVLPLEDDWELLRPFDLAPIATALRAGVFRCVRMAYIGYTEELRGTFIWSGGVHWLALDPASPERHVFSGGPRLETVAFERDVGLWPENLNQGQTEMDVASRAEARTGVAWPVELIKPTGDLFAHIGTAKAGEDEPGARGSASSMQGEEASND
jgi:hypothetical protein